MPSPFEGLSLDTRAKSTLYLVHPVTRLPITDATGQKKASITLLSWDSDEAQTHRIARDNKERQLGRPLTAEEDWIDMGQMLARMTVEWTLVGLDKRVLDVPCTYDLAAEAYNSLGLRWVRNQVLAHLNANVAHLPLAGSTDSDPGDDTSSG